MDLYRMLSEDLSARLDMERYNGMGHEREDVRQNITVQTEGIEVKRENSASATRELEEAKRENIHPAEGERTEVKERTPLRLRVSWRRRKEKADCRMLV